MLAGAFVAPGTVASDSSTLSSAALAGVVGLVALVAALAAWALSTRWHRARASAAARQQHPRWTLLPQPRPLLPTHTSLDRPSALRDFNIAVTPPSVLALASAAPPACSSAARADAALPAAFASGETCVSRGGASVLVESVSPVPERAPVPANGAHDAGAAAAACATAVGVDAIIPHPNLPAIRTK